MAQKCTINEPWKGWRSCRQRPPGAFDKRSFRLKRLSGSKVLVVGCPKGKFNARADRCRVGMGLQAIRTKVK